MFPERFGHLVNGFVFQIVTTEHNHFNRGGVNGFFLVRIGTCGDSVLNIPGIFFLQFLNNIIADVHQTAVRAQRLGNSRSRGTGHDPCTVDRAVLQHIGRTAEGDVFRFDFIREFDAGCGEMSLAFVVNGRTGRSNRKMFAFHIFQFRDTGFIGHNHLVGIQVQTGNGFQVFISMAFKAVRTVHALVCIAADCDGNLGFPFGNHVQVGNTAGRCLAGCTNRRNGFVPVIGNGCTYCIQGAGRRSRREINLNFIRSCRRSFLRCFRLFVTAAAAS